MANRLNFITRVVMLVVAGTLVFVVIKTDYRPAASEEAHAPEKSERDPGRVRVELRKPRQEAPLERREAFPGIAMGQMPMPRPGELRSDLRVQVAMEHGDLEERAQRVEAFALRRLGRLTEQLDLTAEQQRRIFPVLVRGSQSYDPRMRIVSGSQAHPLTSAEDPSSTAPVDKSREQALVQGELNAAQSEEMVNESIRDLLIWEEIIDGLANDLDRATPGQVDGVPQNGTAGAPATETPAADPAVPLESHGGRNLFDSPGN